MRKYLYIILGIIGLAFLTLSLNIGNEKYFLNNFKKYIPQNMKIFLKEKIFVYQNQKILKKMLSDEINRSQKLKNQAFLISLNKLYFNLQTDDQRISNLKIFKSGATDILSRRGYLQFFHNKLYFVTGSGKIYKGNLFKEKKIILSNINTNFQNKAGIDHLLKEKSIVNHFLIEDNKIYLSFVKKIKKNCYTSSILVAEMGKDFLNFNDFFSLDKCLSNFFNYSSGGRLAKFDENFLILTIGDYDPYSENEPYSQYDNDMRGKVLKINKNTGEYNILSKGNRNPQGLYFEKQNNLIFLSDHGPKGGDEINFQNVKANKIENYGWPIASYGEHYKKKDLSKISIFNSNEKRENEKKLREKYNKQPLHKSHKERGFKEPIKYWTNPNLVPTQLVVIYNNEVSEFNIYIASLGNTGDLHKSLHHLRLDNKFKLIESNYIKINQRIRDIIYLKEFNSLLMYLEESSSIALLKLNENYNLK